jgi:hypothetical protein
MFYNLNHFYNNYSAFRGKIHPFEKYSSFFGDRAPQFFNLLALKTGKEDQVDIYCQIRKKFFAQIFNSINCKKMNEK